MYKHLSTISMIAGDMLNWGEFPKPKSDDVSETSEEFFQSTSQLTQARKMKRFSMSLSEIICSLLSFSASKHTLSWTDRDLKNSK